MMTRKFNQLLISLGVTITLMANAYPQAARTVMVQSNTGVLLFPTNLWTANASAARSGLSLAAHATNPTVPVISGGTGATNAAAARVNLDLVWAGLTNANAADFRSALGVPLAALTNTSNTTFLTALGFGPNNSPSLAGLALTNGTNSLALSASAAESRTNLGLVWAGLTNSSATDFRSALGLPWSGLTNTNASNFQTALFGSGTFPVLVNSGGAVTSPTNFLSALFGTGTNAVLVNTNGVVVSPTNFWSYAPGAVVVQDFTTNVLGSATNQITSARNVFVYSFSTNIIVSGAVHTLELPTNASSGDFVTVTHSGTTSSPTAVRVAGTTNNIVSLSQIEEQIRFVYYNSAWRIDAPRALTRPLYFSASSAAANAAASRTNLGIPLTALTNSDNASFRSAIGIPLAALTNANNAAFRAAIDLPLAALTSTNNASFRSAIDLPWSGLTNTNETSFQAAIFTNTNTAPTSASNFTNVAGWISIKVGTLTNNYRIPVYQ